MKKQTFSLIVLLTILLSSFSVMADDDSYEFLITEEDEIYEDEKTGHRMPPKRDVCEITKNGVIFSVHEPRDISLFEIYDLSGNSVVVFTQEMEFINFIFTSDGEFEIRFRLLNGNYLSGFISI